MTDFDRLPGDDVLLLALAKGSTVRSPAEQTSISVATAFRRFRDASFVAELNRVRGGLWIAALGKPTEASSRAIERLAVLIDEVESEAVRLSACKAVLDMGDMQPVSFFAPSKHFREFPKFGRARVVLTFRGTLQTSGARP